MRSPHMDMHDASLSDSQRNMPAVPLTTGHIMWRGQQGSFRQVSLGPSMRLSQRPGARWDQQVSPSLLEGESGIESERVSIILYWQSRSQLELRGGGASRNKTTPAYQKRAEKNTLLSWVNLTEQNKWKKGFKTAFLRGVNRSDLDFHCLGGFIGWIWDSYSRVSFLQYSLCLRTNTPREMARTDIKRACCLSSVTYHQAFITAFYRDLLWVFGWLERANIHALITSAWFISSNMQVCCFNSNPSKSSIQWFTL